MYRREGKEKREARFDSFKIIKVRKNPNSSHICVFGWFELGLRVVLIWFCFGLETV